MYRACKLKDQTLKKIRTLHFSDREHFKELAGAIFLRKILGHLQVRRKLMEPLCETR